MHTALQQNYHKTETGGEHQGTNLHHAFLQMFAERNWWEKIGRRKRERDSQALERYSPQYLWPGEEVYYQIKNAGSPSPKETSL